jgi:hypothetical protein
MEWKPEGFRYLKPADRESLSVGKIVLFGDNSDVFFLFCCNGQNLGIMVLIISEKEIFIYNVGKDSNIYHTIHTI